jgi:exportin-T
VTLILFGDEKKSDHIFVLRRQHLSDYLEEMLKQCHNLLVLPSPDNGHGVSLSPNDQLFMYETAGVLIVHANAPAEKKQAMMRHLLSPIVSKYDALLQVRL